jgi:hypothetical protein
MAGRVAFTAGISLYGSALGVWSLTFLRTEATLLADLSLVFALMVLCLLLSVIGALLLAQKPNHNIERTWSVHQRAKVSFVFFVVSLVLVPFLFVQLLQLTGLLYIVATP